MVAVSKRFPGNLWIIPRIARSLWIIHREAETHTAAPIGSRR